MSIAAKIVQTVLTKRSLLPSLAVLSLLMLSSTGCSTPAYSAKERGQMISRNMGLEWQMAQDDIDETLMLRPISVITRWNVR